MNILQAKQRLQDLGVTAVWYTEDPKLIVQLDSSPGNVRSNSYRATNKTESKPSTLLANNDPEIVHLYSDSKEDDIDSINS